MNWKEYLIMSEKTLSLQFNCDDTKDQKLLHATIGILTEVDELLDNHYNEIDKTNVIEECADALWYVAILSRELDIDYPTITIRDSKIDPMLKIVKIIRNSCKLLDIMKKKIYYNKEIDYTVFKNLSHIIMLDMADYINYHELVFEDILDLNIAKLKERYGDAFSSEKAINRNIEAERTILESGK